MDEFVSVIFGALFTYLSYLVFFADIKKNHIIKISSIIFGVLFAIMAEGFEAPWFFIPLFILFPIYKMRGNTIKHRAVLTLYGLLTLVLLSLGVWWLLLAPLLMALVWLFRYAERQDRKTRPATPIQDSVEHVQPPPASREMTASTPSPSTPLRPFPDPVMVPVMVTDQQNETRHHHVVPSAPTSAAPPLHPLVKMAQDIRLPFWIRKKIHILEHESKATLYQLDDAGGTIRERPMTEKLYLVRAIRDEYAPEALEAYIHLPQPQAHTVPVENNKTAADLLGEQLDMMLQSVQETILDNLQEESQRLKIHGRFLRERLQKSRDDLNLD